MPLKPDHKNRRRAELGELTISVTPRGEVDPDTARRYEDMTVRFIEETAQAFGLG